MLNGEYATQSKGSMTKKLSYVLAFVVISGVLFGLAITPDKSLEELLPHYTNADSKFVEVAGMQVHYRDTGQGEPIVLLHSAAASLHVWESWATKLSQSYRVIRMDMPGFGLTGPNPDDHYSLDDYTDFVDRFTEKLGVKTFSLVGNALGGQIAWIYAAKNPQKVTSLALINSAGFSHHYDDLWVFQLARTPILNSIIQYVTPTSLIKENLQTAYFDQHKVTSDLVTRYRDLTLRAGNRQAFINRAQVSFKDYTDYFANIESPTLLIWSENDPWLSTEKQLGFHKRIKNVEVSVLQKTGRMAMEENPIESLAPFTKFLHKNQSASQSKIVSQ